jgi:ubiquinone/menaquinone biosynthesis C-methylase UbiE
VTNAHANRPAGASSAESDSALSLDDQVYAPLDAQMIAWLDVPRGAVVLDAGCGRGAMAVRFAEAVGPDGAVVAIDKSQEALAATRRFMAASPVAERITVREADLLRLPFDDATFELAWCSFVLHHIADPVAAARELRRVVRAGGRVVVRETGVPLRMLPFDLGIGAPGLLDRLRVAHNRWFADHRYATPVAQPYPWGWPQVLRDAGCQEVTVRTFMLELLPPFTVAQQALLVETLRKPLDDPARRVFLDLEDQRTLEQLTDPASSWFVLNRPDLHILSGMALFVGSV